MTDDSFKRVQRAAPTRFEDVPHWSPVARVAFRFCFAYFAMFALATQISGSLVLVPGFSFRGIGSLWPMRDITFWAREHVFRFPGPLVYTGNSRDTDFYWVQTFWLLAVAVTATGLWSMLDRRRDNYQTLHKWFRVFIRLGLAGQMLEYGMTKVIPNQFPSPPLVTLVTPVSNLSLQGLLWTSVGASPAYEIFTGCAELLAGVLLLVPRTAILGALIGLADMIQVFTLNLTYDIGVKLISLHLILMILFLLAPEFPRFANFFLGRAAGPSTQAPVFRQRGANRIALAVQIVLGVYLLGMQAYVNWIYWNVDGGGRAKSPLYGIWNVEQVSIDGEVRPALLNDYDRRWRRVIFDSPDTLVFQRLDDSFARYGVSIDVAGRTLALTKGASKTWKASFSFQRPVQDRLTLVGEMDDFTIRLELQLAGFDTFRLLNSRFRWVRPPD